MRFDTRLSDDAGQDSIFRKCCPCFAHSRPQNANVRDDEASENDEGAAVDNDNLAIFIENGERPQGKWNAD